MVALGGNSESLFSLCARYVRYLAGACKSRGRASRAKT